MPAPTRAVVGAFVLLLSFAASALAQSSGSRILVVPFDNLRKEPRLSWMSEASAVLLADELIARGVPAIPRNERVRAFEQLHLPLTASLSRATVIKIGQLVGASEVIVGSFAVDDQQLTVEAHSIRVDVGRLQPHVTERGQLQDLFKIFSALAGRLAPDGKAPSSIAPITPPLNAFENFIKGLVAESTAAQATFLETAIREYAAFDRAKLALWDVRHEQGDHAAALTAVRAVPAESPYARRAQFRAGTSLLELAQYDEAYETLKVLSETAPPSAQSQTAAILNNLAIVQLRRGSTPQTGTASYYLTKAADLDPNDIDYLFNLGYAYVIEKNYQGATYWLREAVRRHPGDAEAHYVLAAALEALGSTVEAAREKELARQLSSRAEELEQQANADKVLVARGLERLRTELEASRLGRADQTIANTAQREQRELATFHLDRGRRLFEAEQDREAMVELRRAIYLSPYEAQAHLLIGRIHLRAGRPQDAVAALKISLWSEETAPARVTLAEAYLAQKDPDAARAELEKALKLDPENANAKRLLATIK